MRVCAASQAVITAVASVLGSVPTPREARVALHAHRRQAHRAPLLVREQPAAEMQLLREQQVPHVFDDRPLAVRRPLAQRRSVGRAQQLPQSCPLGVDEGDELFLHL
jgi:hypothetical protein